MAVSAPWHCLIVADSLRYDVCVEAATPFLDEQGPIVKAWSQGTFTWPSHLAMMVGHLPHSFDGRPLYNRYRQQLWRMGVGPGTGGGSAQVSPHLEVPSEWTIVKGFATKGYRTIGTGAVSWFAHPFWASTFHEFAHIPDAEDQLAWLAPRLSANDPTFLFVNLSATHEPYQFGGRSEAMPARYQEHKLGSGPLTADDFAALRARQVSAASYVDGVVARLCALAPIGSTIVFTADHGECFGEDGFFGHGFFHPKVMEVPLLIFEKRC